MATILAGDLIVADHKIDPPLFEEQAGALTVTIRAPIGPTLQATPQAAPQVTPQVVAILKAAEGFLSRSELQEATGLKDREHFRRAYLEPLLAAGWIEMAIPDKLRSSKQRYRTTKPANGR
jgi:ATP-dependent DNA helicase RecG